MAEPPGFLLIRTGFRAGVLIAVPPIITVLDPPVSIGIASPWLHDSFGAHPQTWRGGALTVMTSGVIALDCRARVA